MSRVRRFVDFLRDAAEVATAAPIAIATTGGIVKVIGHSIANPAISSAIIKAGNFLVKGGTYLAKTYAKGIAIAAKALGKGAKVSAPVVKAVAKTVPGSRYVPGIIKSLKVGVPIYLNAAMMKKAVDEYGKVKKLTGDPIARLGSERPKFSFQSVFKTIKDALLFR